MPFEIGVNVRHKSGTGPKMTVIGITEVAIMCQWYDAKKGFEQQGFIPEVLEIDGALDDLLGPIRG